MPPNPSTSSKTPRLITSIQRSQINQLTGRLLHYCENVVDIATKLLVSTFTSYLFNAVVNLAFYLIPKEVVSSIGGWFASRFDGAYKICKDPLAIIKKIESAKNLMPKAMLDNAEKIVTQLSSPKFKQVCKETYMPFSRLFVFTSILHITSSLLAIFFTHRMSKSTSTQTSPSLARLLLMAYGNIRMTDIRQILDIDRKLFTEEKAYRYIEQLKKLESELSVAYRILRYVNIALLPLVLIQGYTAGVEEIYSSEIGQVLMKHPMFKSTTWFSLAMGLLKKPFSNAVITNSASSVMDERRYRRDTKALTGKLSKRHKIINSLFSPLNIGSITTNPGPTLLTSQIVFTINTHTIQFQRQTFNFRNKETLSTVIFDFLLSKNPNANLRQEGNQIIFNANTVNSSRFKLSNTFIRHINNQHQKIFGEKRKPLLNQLSALLTPYNIQSKDIEEIELSGKKSSFELAFLICLDTSAKSEALATQLRSIYGAERIETHTVSGVTKIVVLGDEKGKGRTSGSTSSFIIANTTKPHSPSKTSKRRKGKNTKASKASSSSKEVEPSRHTKPSSSLWTSALPEKICWPSGATFSLNDSTCSVKPMSGRALLHPRRFISFNTSPDAFPTTAAYDAFKEIAKDAEVVPKKRKKGIVHNSLKIHTNGKLFTPHYKLKRLGEHGNIRVFSSEPEKTIINGNTYTLYPFKVVSTKAHKVRRDGSVATIKH